MNAGPTTIAIGDGSLVLQLPEQLSFELEEDGTIRTFLETLPELLALRFSSITVEAKSPTKTSKIDLAAEILTRGEREGRETGKAEDKAWYHEDQDSEEDGRPIWLRFWYLGCRNNQIIISLCCDAHHKQDTRVLETVRLVPKLIAGLKTRGEKSPLTSRESALLDEQRALVEDILRTRYDTYVLPKLKADLPALQRLVDDRVFSPEQEHEWSCVGVVFGDVIANELGLDWIAQCDEYGVEPALNLKATSITLFPRSMILKRIEKGEVPDLQYLLSQLAESVEKLRRDGC